MVQIFTEGMNCYMGRDGKQILHQILSTRKISKFRGDITTFTQFDTESIYDAWERYKGLIRKVPNHGLPDWLEIQFFYNGL